MDLLDSPAAVAYWSVEEPTNSLHWPQKRRPVPHDWPAGNPYFCVCVCVPALTCAAALKKGCSHGARADNGSRTMYSHHLVTCSFTRVECAPKKGTTGGKAWVQTAPYM